jgi:hypothetical protein
MIKSKLLSFIAVILILFNSCNDINKPDDLLGPKPGVYKFKEGVNYIEFVPVILDSTRTKVIGYNTNQTVEDIKARIVYEYKGYYYGIIALNTGYLSLTFDEFNSMIDTLSDGDFDINALLIECNPFEALYSDPDDYLIMENPPDSFSSLITIFDTVKFQHLVDNEEFELYLNRVL